MVIAVRCDEVVHPGRARSKHHGALRARDCIGGPSSFPGQFDGRGGGGCTRGFRAEPAGLWNRRVQDAVQVTPVRRPVCAGLACEAIKEADTSEVFRLGWFDAETPKNWWSNFLMSEIHSISPLDTLNAMSFYQVSPHVKQCEAAEEWLKRGTFYKAVHALYILPLKKAFF